MWCMQTMCLWQVLIGDQRSRLHKGILLVPLCSLQGYVGATGKKTGTGRSAVRLVEDQQDWLKIDNRLLRGG
jgi:hypothetical protein